MVRPLSLAQHTLYADLLEQEAEGLFDPDLLENGSILVRPNRAGAPADHAYYQGYRLSFDGAGQGRRYARYLGRADDPEVAKRIARFSRVKTIRAERATTVRALIGTGMPRPDRMTGRIIEALARTGLFPEDAVLLGDAAYQTYGGTLGVRLSKALSQPFDDVVARSIRIALRAVDHIAKIHAALCGVDPGFASAPCSADLAGTKRFASSNRIQVDVLVASEVMLLTDQPIQSLILHGPGIPVTVPAPDRWVVHTLLEQGTRVGDTGYPSRALARAAELIEALNLAGREHALAKALSGACRTELQTGIQHLPAATRAILEGQCGVRQADRAT